MAIKGATHKLNEAANTGKVIYPVLGKITSGDVPSGHYTESKYTRWGQLPSNVLLNCRREKIDDFLSVSIVNGDWTPIHYLRNIKITQMIIYDQFMTHYEISCYQIDQNVCLMIEMCVDKLQKSRLLICKF